MTQQLLIGTIRLYQMAISPLFPQACRFYPTCSEYAIQAIRTHGTIKGLLKASARVMKCHPWHPGGYDPV
jgi:uncharacterized protein